MGTNKIGRMCYAITTQEAVDEAVKRFRKSFEREPDGVLLSLHDQAQAVDVSCPVVYAKFIRPKHAFAYYECGKGEE